MSKLLNKAVSLAAIASLTSSSFMAYADSNNSTPAAVPLDRPSQYIMLAFDGSKSLDMWDETTNFAELIKEKQHTDLKFTYFLSGVYWLHTGNTKLYHHPKHKAGGSAIGFGSNPADIKERINKVNFAFSHDHEMASHANGHFDATAEKWKFSDWDSEFEQFNNLIFNAPKNNGFEASYLFSASDIVGFRAPLLEMASGLYDVLNKYKFRYDTSKVASRMDYWPEKINGIWNFPLAPLKIAGTGKSTLSMDYNFYVSQSGGNPNPAKSAEFEEQMYKTYLNYFANNYNGNRAPVHIGHHFSLWNKGAYWRAMQRFAAKVCGMPEVKCVTYKELADHMDSLTTEQIAAYKKGHFAKLSSPLKIAASAKPLDIETKISISNDNTIKTVLEGIDKNGTKLALEINGNKIANIKENEEIALVDIADNFSDLLNEKENVITVSGYKIIDGQAKEVIRTSRELIIDDSIDSGFTVSNQELETMKICNKHNHDEDTE